MTLCAHLPAQRERESVSQRGVAGSLSEAQCCSVPFFSPLCLLLLSCQGIYRFSPHLLRVQLLYEYGSAILTKPLSHFSFSLSGRGREECQRRVAFQPFVPPVKGISDLEQLPLAQSLLPSALLPLPSALRLTFSPSPHRAAWPVSTRASERPLLWSARTSLRYLL